MAPSKALVLLALVAILVLSGFLYSDGNWRGEYYLMYLVPPVVVLIVYAIRTGDVSFLSQPVDWRKSIWNYFVDSGWWVLFWLVLIFGFAVAGGR